MKIELLPKSFKIPARKRYYQKPNPIIGSPHEMDVCMMLHQRQSCLQIHTELRHKRSFKVSYDRVLEFKEEYYDKQREEVKTAIRSAQSHIETGIQIRSIIHTDTLTRTEYLRQTIRKYDEWIDLVTNAINASDKIKGKHLDSIQLLTKAQAKCVEDFWEEVGQKESLKSQKASLIEAVRYLVWDIVMREYTRDESYEIFQRFDKALKNL